MVNNSDSNVVHMPNFDSKILSSSHINFLFGAGVNGRAFPQMSGFGMTIEVLEKALGRSMDNFENDLDTLTEAKSEQVFRTFKKEYELIHKSLNFEEESIQDIERMFQHFNRLVLEAENRTITTKQVNIYTLNYDEIVEYALKKIGVLHNVISSSNIDNHDKFFDLVGYNYMRNRYVPTYLISKIHGDISNPILPGRKKYDTTLEAKRFEILFKMKSQLSRINSILIVIGYSGRDNHINRLIKDCIASGLTIYWFRYDASETIPEEMVGKISVIDQIDSNDKTNITKLCTLMMEALWDVQSEE
ncbi:SIR2 family protein [Erysipelothrix rhusiopathiae]|nr:SIR2 family protein [Erysipelothrix rhusiopathiae]